MLRSSRGPVRGTPGFQDRGSTTGAITPAELQRLAETGGTLVINGEEVDVASLVRDNVAYGETQKRGRGGRQRGEVYQRDLTTLANHLTGGLGTGGVSPLRTGISRGPGHHL